MIILLSPAKSLDFNDKEWNRDSSSTRFNHESQQLINKLSKTSMKSLMSLMNISKDLAKLNRERYESYDIELLEERGKEAMRAFNGGVYQGLDAKTLKDEQWDYAQDHVRILSGLYGLLRPMDKIQEYRLEMGTRLPIRRKKNLYEFWGDKITNLLNEDLEEQGAEVIVNCASQEYFHAINTKKLRAKVIDVHFKEMHKGELKFISFNAKKARGLMTRFAIDHSVTKVEDLKTFNYEDYAFDPSLSSESSWMFTR